MKQRATLVLCLALAPACAYRYIERRVESLAQVVDEADRAGAATCAPVELALSRVHLEFARRELRDGDAPRAERHLTLAEPNGQAALRLAKEQKCSQEAAESRGSSPPTSSRWRVEPRASSLSPRSAELGSRAHSRASTEQSMFARARTSRAATAAADLRATHD